MISVYSNPTSSIRSTIAMCLVALTMYGCSGSSGPASDTGQVTDNENSDSTTTDTGIPPDVSQPPSAITTQVEFAITVPAYMSNELQVNVSWGSIDTNAAWVRDESWTLSSELPVDTENLLTVTFADRNGALTLGTVERQFKTGSNSSEVVAISAEEFDIERWDNDGDGIANLSELIAGNNPDGGDAPLPVQASLELLPVKTFRLTWQSATNADSYRVFENPDGISGFTDISGELDASTTNFDQIVALYSRTNAEYIVQSCNEQGCRDSNTVLVSGTLENAIGYIKASNTGESDRFGSSVSISADGNTLAVGAFGESSTGVGVNADQDDNSSFGIGAVYVFARLGEVWQQQAYLKADRNTFRDSFGEAIALSDDGDILVVGASGIDGETGEAWIFSRTGGAWQQSTSLQASNAEGGDSFGRAVAISADGKTVAVGAFGESSSASGINGDEEDNSFWRAGAVYVYVETNGIWQQQAYIKQSNPDRISSFDEPADNFGWDSISLSADGNTLAAGASGEDSAAAGINGNGSDNSLELSGAVYVYLRTDDSWQQQAYIKASEPGVRHFFGTSVSLSASGNTMAVGAYGVEGVSEDSGNTGAVYIFGRLNGVWQQQQTIQGNNTERRDYFGRQTSLSSDGKTLAVGTTAEDGGGTGINGEDNNAADASGAGYVFKLNDGVWRQVAYVKAKNTEKFDAFGSSISLSGDGNTLAIGASSENGAGTGVNADEMDNAASGSGAVYLY